MSSTPPELANVHIVSTDRFGQPSQILINGIDVSSEVAAATIVLEPGRPAQIHITARTPGAITGPGVVFVHPQEIGADEADATVRTFLAGVPWEQVLPEAMADSSLGDDPGLQLKAVLVRYLEAMTWT